MRTGSTLLAAVLLAGAAAPASAQIVRGRLVEAGSSQPIAGADVRAVLGDSAVASAQSSGNGAFLLVLPQPGTYRVRVDRIGYASGLSDELEAAAGEVLETVIQLSVAAVPLPPVMVVERRSLGASADFYRRMGNGQRTGVGRFITRTQLDSASTLTSALTSEPLVSVVYDDRGMGRPVLLSQGGCVPRLYLNGAQITIGLGESLDEMVDPHNLEGVEIYRNRNEMPMDFAGPGECGAIAMWTRPGDPSARGGLWRWVAAGAAAVGIAAFMIIR